MLARTGIVLLLVSIATARGQEPPSERRPDRTPPTAPTAPRRPEAAVPGVLQSLPSRFAKPEPTAAATQDLPEVSGPVERLVFFAHNAPVSQLAPLINAHFQGGDQGSFRAIGEPVSNCLMITASPELLPQVTSLLEQLDRAPAIIALEVLVVERTQREPAAVAGAPSRTSASDAAADELPGGVAGPSDEVLQKIQRWESEGKLSLLHRVQLTMLENQPGLVQIGQRRPVVQGVTLSSRGTTRNTIDRNIGMILGATPRAASDGSVTVNLDFEKSDMVTHPSDPPLSVASDGEKVPSMRTLTSTAKTTLQIPAAQSVILTDVRTTGGGEQSRVLLVVSAKIVKSPAKGEKAK